MVKAKKTKKELKIAKTLKKSSVKEKEKPKER